MVPEILAEQFELLADAPNGVRKLRELVLQLAVQGKLVEQDPEDEPAEELLARVAEEKERLLTAKSIRKQASHSPVKSSDVPYRIPSAWRWARFGEICLHIEAGWSPRCESRPRNDGEWGVLKISAVTWGTFDPSENKALPANQTPRKESEVKPGDFIMSRANTGELVGKSVVVEDTPPQLLLNDKLLRVAFPEFVSRHYFNCFNNGPIAREHYLRTASGTSVSMRNVSRENVVQMLVPVPPATEQRRIVAKLYELMALCDELEERQGKRSEVRIQACTASHAALTSATAPKQFARHWTRIRHHFDLLYDTPKNVQELRQVILQLAVQGKLVEQEEGDEPATVLLEEARAAQSASADTNGTRTPKAQEDGYAVPPPWLPAGWAWSKVADVFEVSGGITKNSVRKPVQNFFPYLRVANVQRGRLDLNEIEYFELFEGELDRWRLAKRDLLVVEGNGSEKEIGRCALWNGEIANCVHQNHIIRCRPLTTGIEGFVIAYLNSPLGVDGMKKLAITTSGLYSLSVGKVRGIPVPVPPRREQERILSKVAQLMSICDDLDSKLTQSLAKSEKLMEAVVTGVLGRTKQTTRIG